LYEPKIKFYGGITLKQGVNKFISILCIIFLSVYMTSCAKGISDNDVSMYDEYVAKVSGAESFMPRLDDLDKYENVSVRYKSNEYLTPASVVIFIEYNNSKYLAEKQAVLSNYTFLLHPVILNGDYLLPEYEIQYKGYTIKVVEESYPKLIFPKYIGMIGFNDKEQTLCFMFYSDVEADYFIVESNGKPNGVLAKLIDEYFDFVK